MVRFSSLALALLLSFPAQSQIFKITKEQLVQMTSAWQGDRFDDGRPKVPDEMLDKMHGLTVE